MQPFSLTGSFRLLRVKTDLGERDTWTVGRVIRYMSERLKREGFDDYRISSELIVAKALGMDRLGVYLNFDRPLSLEERDKVRKLFKRRLKREPIFYIVGEREFFSRAFKVEKGVLIPRPETETLVEAFLEDVKDSGFTLLDAGCGCGAVGITIAMERPGCRVVLLDKFHTPCRISADNVKKFSLEKSVYVVRGNWLSAFKDSSFDFIVSNPPYIKDAEMKLLQEEIRAYEPWEALSGGQDGLSSFKEISKEALRVLRPGGRIYLEIGYSMEEDVKKVFSRYRYIKSVKDLSGISRVLVFEV